jgi:cytochrome c553
MEPYSKMAIQLGADDVAGYFAAQTKQPTPIAANADAVARGRAASEPCVVCHGPAGKGDPAKNIPDLSGQPAGYLQSQMLLFKADRRSPGDEALKALKALMKTIPDERFADLAAYYSSLR